MITGLYSLALVRIIKDMYQLVKFLHVEFVSITFAVLFTLQIFYAHALKILG